jgi:hypothetical protein
MVIFLGKENQMRKIEPNPDDPTKFVKELKREVGKSVSVKAKWRSGETIDGTLDEVGPRRILVDGTSITYSDLQFCIVRDGGDWVTKQGHSSDSRTERIHVRCSERQKKKLIAAATRAGKPLSAYVLDAALG